MPFDNDPKDTATLFEHLKRSFHHVLNNLGPHGLPLIGRADWNDCLNLNCFSETPGESFQTTGNRAGRTAESVFIAGLFVHVAPDYAALAEAMAFAGEAKAAREHAAKMEKTVLEHGWDGEWFLRAYDFFGKKIGSKECEDGQILIESQGYCVMAGIGVASGHAKKALDSVRDRLETAHGIVLNQPAYKAYHVELGEISSLPAGLQGERRHLLPQQPVDHDRGDGASAAATGPSPSGRRSRPRTARRSPRSTASSPTSTRR